MGMWAQAGRPDFARCAEIIARFDPQLREQLNRSEGKVLQWLLFFAWRTSTTRGSDMSYVSFSQDALGKKFGRSRWTVQRAVEKLTAYNLISPRRRRPDSSGKWSTNLYFLADKLKAILARILSRSGKIVPSAKMLHKNAEHTHKAGALPLTVRAASQDKDNPDDTDARNAAFRALLERHDPEGLRRFDAICAAGRA